jgi:hypothetical protein
LKAQGGGLSRELSELNLFAADLRRRAQIKARLHRKGRRGRRGRRGRKGNQELPKSGNLVNPSLGSDPEHKEDQESTNFNTSPTAITSNTLPTVTRKPTKEEIVAAMQECATKLGHVPS